MKFHNYRSLFILLVCVGLYACQDFEEKKSTEVHEKNDDNSKKVAIYLPQEPSDVKTDSVDENQQLSEGSFRIDDISFDDSSITLEANNASIRELLFYFADEFGFQVKSDVRYDGSISLEPMDIPLEYLIRKLLDGHGYSIRYVDNSDSSEPNIASISIGSISQSSAQQQSPLRASVVSSDELASELAIDFPFGKGAVTFKTYSETDSYIYNDVSELLNQSPLDETVNFINDTNLDSTGLRILAEVFHETDNIDIKKEVIGALSSSDSFAAKWLTLNALKDVDDGVVIKALEEVSLWLDPATVPYVESLQSNPNQEIQGLVQEIIEANSDVSTDSFINLSQEERASQAQAASQKLSARQRQSREARAKLLEEREAFLKTQ